ncbi:MAG: hypothetical protein HC884_12700 [Chloroflexaceae bacterium]|nr:hypothetical protein [Chloroflexaceae bacterium]
MVDIQDQVHEQFINAHELAVRSVRAWNELLMISADMAFDVVLKNWNYNRSLRSSTEQAVENAIKTQQNLTSEMMQVWQGYTSNVQEVFGRAVDGKTPRC